MSAPSETIFEAAVAASASKVTYSGAATMGVGWWFSSEFAVLMGFVLGVAGFAVNWYYRWKQDQREEQVHLLRMRDRHDSPPAE